jgi:hypothetical protein
MTSPGAMPTSPARSWTVEQSFWVFEIRDRGLTRSPRPYRSPERSSAKRHRSGGSEVGRRPAAHPQPGGLPPHLAGRGRRQRVALTGPACGRPRSASDAPRHCPGHVSAVERACCGPAYWKSRVLRRQALGEEDDAQGSWVREAA